MSEVKMKDIVSEEKPREKLMERGVFALSNVELLALLLDTGSIEQSVLSLSHEVLKACGGIKGLRAISMNELMNIKGIGSAKACRVIAALELSKRISKGESKDAFQIQSAETVAAMFMEELRYLKKEVFKVLFLDTKNKIICDREISVGSLNSSIVHPREVFKEAVLQSANKVFLIHNHPSGDPTPSKEDIVITKRLREAGQLLGVEVLDHIVIGDGTYKSFQEIGYW